MQTKKTALILAIISCVLITGCSKTSKTSKAVDEQIGLNMTKAQPGNKGETPALESGLLLGLALKGEEGTEDEHTGSAPDQYRSLWIYQNDGKFTFTVKSGYILAPYKESFWKIENSRFTLSEPNELADNDGLTVYDKYSSYYSYNNLTAHLAEKPGKPLLTDSSFKKLFVDGKQEYLLDSYKSETEWLLFAGNQYVSILSDSYMTGGGTMRFGSNNISLLKISDLASYESREKTIKMIDLLDDKSRQKLKSSGHKYDKTLEEDDFVSLKQTADTNNFAFFRSSGRWHLKIPVYEEYQHQGNGSEFHTLIDYIDTEIVLPTSLTGHDSLSVEWSVIKKKYPQAKDAISSPKNDLLAVQTTKELLVFENPMKGIEKPDLIIPMSENEKIILNQWALGKNVAKWTGMLNAY